MITKSKVQQRNDIKSIDWQMNGFILVPDVSPSFYPLSSFPFPPLELPSRAFNKKKWNRKRRCKKKTKKKRGGLLERAVRESAPHLHAALPLAPACPFLCAQTSVISTLSNGTLTKRFLPFLETHNFILFTYTHAHIHKHNILFINIK